jgi:hypothetical protein
MNWLALFSHALDQKASNIFLAHEIDFMVGCYMDAGYP